MVEVWGVFEAGKTLLAPSRSTEIDARLTKNVTGATREPRGNA